MIYVKEMNYYMKKFDELIERDLESIFQEIQESLIKNGKVLGSMNLFAMIFKT